jgi:hypothetical protein
MPTQFPGNDNSPEDNKDEETQPLRDEILQWLDQLQRSDRSLYNLMALEVWAIAQTMDGLVPGFWNRFMENRQLALKEFLDHRQTQPESSPPDPHQSSQSETEQDGMMEGDT